MSLQQYKLIEMSLVAQTRVTVYTSMTFLECVYIHCLQKSIKNLSHIRTKYLKLIQLYDQNRILAQILLRQENT